MPSAIAASLPSVSLCGFKYFDQPHFGFRPVWLYIAMVSSAVSASLWLSAPFMASDTSTSLLVTSFMCELEMVSFTVGCTIVWLQLHEFHFQSSARAASAASAPLPVISLCSVKLVSYAFGYTVVWLQLYQLYFRLSAYVASVVPGSFLIPSFVTAAVSASFSSIGIMCAFSYSSFTSGCQPLWLQVL